MISNTRTYTDTYLLKKLSRYLIQSKIRLAIIFIFIVISITIQVYLPLLISQILDGVNAKNGEVLVYFVLLYFALMIAASIVQYITEYFFTVIGEESIYNLRNDAFDKMLTQSQDFFDTNSTGDIASRLTNDVENMKFILSGSFLYTILSIFQVIGIVTIMLQRSILLTFVVLTIIPLALLSVWANKKYVRNVLDKSSREIGEISSVITENILGARVNAAFVRIEENTQEFVVINQKLANTTYQANKNAAIVGPLGRVFSFLVIALILLIGTVLKNSGDISITIGALFLFITYSRNISGPIIQITQMSNQVQNSFASFDRIVVLLDRHSSIPENENTNQLITNGKVELKNVTFSYGSGNILDNFSLTIESGEKIAIVGTTGAGKSTITRLITRLYDTVHGEVFIDSENIKNYELKVLRDRIGVVLQEPIFYSNSIRDNLNLGTEVSDEKLYQILEHVGASFVKSLPLGLDTPLGERASRISTGQKQLLSLARTLILDPRIIILDEATSSIDSETETVIQEALEKVLDNKTTIIIAHRLSTVKIADRIIVLSDGKIIEEGTFEELLNLDGTFAELYNLQIET